MGKVKVKGQKKLYHANTVQNKARRFTLDKVNLSQKMTRDRLII
jgi:hypothetical protein